MKFREFQFLFKFLLILSFSAYFGALTYSDEKSDEMLEEAVQAGDLAQVQASLDQDANPDHYPDAPIEDENRRTLLWNTLSSFPDTQEEEFAVLRIVQLLLGIGIDVNRRDMNGNSVMHYRVQMLSGVLSHPAKVTHLFESMAFLKGEGGDLELKNNTGETPSSLLVTLREKIRLRVPRQLESFNQWIENLEKGSLQKLQ